MFKVEHPFILINNTIHCLPEAGCNPMMVTTAVKIIGIFQYIFTNSQLAVFNHESHLLVYTPTIFRSRHLEVLSIHSSYFTFNTDSQIQFTI